MGLVFVFLLLALPTAQAQQSGGPLPLSAYPRPAADNGRGVHWSPALFSQPDGTVDRYLAEVEQMGLRWLTLMQPDQPRVEHAYLLGQLGQRGIEPILRVYKSHNDPYAHLPALVQQGSAAGVRYYELYANVNVAGLDGGWRPGQRVDAALIARQWIPAARAVMAAGGYPGLPSLSPAGAIEDTEFLRQLLTAILAQGGGDALSRAWLPVQNYMGNLPLDRTDGFSRFVIYDQIARELLGRSLPILASEGGAVLGDRQDPAFPALTPELIAQRTVDAFHFMGSQAPDYLFAFTPWLLVNAEAGGYNGAWESHAWFPAGRDAQPVVAAVKAMSGTEIRPSIPPMDLQRAEAEPTPLPNQEQNFGAAGVLGPVPLEPEPSPEPESRAEPQSPIPNPQYPISNPQSPSGKVSLTEGSITLPTYDFERAFVPTERGDLVFPAPRLDHDRVGGPTDKRYRTLVLENDWLRLTILPELGGRIYRWEDKATGRDILYHNPVVKPTRWGVRGWWLATGGMEWAFPLADHGLNEYQPWTAKRIVDGDSSAAVELSRSGPGDLEVTIQISLNSSARFFAVTVNLRNRSSQPLNSHFWVNAMLAPSPANRTDPNSRLIWPADQFTIHGSAGSRDLPMNATFDWPSGSGTDLSRLSAWPQHLSFFAEPGPNQGAVGLVDPSGDLAVIRSFPHRLVPGIKSFYGPGLDPGLWTDDGSGPYFEIWGGPSKDFDTAIRFQPGQTIRWTEQWYTVPGLGDFVAAGPHAALSLRPQDGGTLLRLASTGSDVMRATGKRLTVRVDGEIVHTGPGDWDVNEIFELSLPQPMGGAPWLVQLTDSQNRVLFAYDSAAGAAVAPSPVDDIEWDERLDELNVAVNRANARPGQSYWKVIKAEFQDPDEGGGRHHIFIEVLDERGNRLVGETVEVHWDSGMATVVTEDKPAPEYAANFPMYNDLGGYRAKMPGLSDEVTGMGLPFGRLHVVYNIVFQRVVKE